MAIDAWLIMLQFVIAIMTLVSVYFIYRTIRSNVDLNQNNLFNELVKQERELRIKLNEYRLEIDKRIDEERDFKEITLMYDTLLLNYYEYFAVCLYHKIVDENVAKRYFKDFLDSIKVVFDNSILFNENYAKRSQYKGIQWLFKKWHIFG